jgi:hypothetical protein
MLIASGVSIMTKNNYLSDKNVKGLVEYLSGLIKGNDFKHNYTIKKGGKNSAWINHNNGQEWKCQDLLDAGKKYFWFGNFDNNNILLGDLSKELRKAIKNGNEKETLCVCMNILEWGGVTNGAYGVTKAYCDNRLIETTQKALSELIPDDNVELDLTGFSEKNGAFIMNASYTKIYSLLSERPFVIYDSRVAAALSLIVKLYWLNSRRDNEELPNSLCLACLDGRGNNSLRCADDIGKNIVFKKANNNDREHALWNVRANWIIEAALIQADIQPNEMIKKMRELEAALFMIGYSV